MSFIMKNTNREIARNRDKSWIGKMVAGKMDYALKPSKLRTARMEHRLSQGEIAVTHELSQTTYGDIERGKRLVKKGMAERISAQVGKKLKELFEEKGKKFLAKR
jgi:DNA-binding XRE family transcriptional regulator